MKTIKILIRGKVQGVFYRATALKNAKSLSINGVVKNCLNGDVEIIAEGNIDKIDDFLNWCKKGPPMAKVSEVFTEEIERMNFKEFKIIY